MRRHLFALLFVASSSLALGFIVTACGGGSLSLPEYFRQVVGTSNEMDDRFAALGIEVVSEEELDLEAGVIEANRIFYNAALPIQRDFADALADIDPPADVEDAHKEIVDATAELVQVYQDVADRLADVGSASELDELFDEPELETASYRFAQACFQLQGIADANGIDVDLEC